jgi:hypothetical protein
MDEKKFWKIIAVLAVVGLFLIAIEFDGPSRPLDRTKPSQ